MRTLIKLLTIMLIMNIFLYIGVNFSISADGSNDINKDYHFYFEGDMLQTVLSSQDDLKNLAKNTKENWTDYDIDFNSNFTKNLQQQGGINVGDGGISFLDSLKIIWAFILTLGNIVIAPLTLFFNFRMPVFVGLMIGVPYFMILVLSLIALVRGVSD